MRGLTLLETLVTALILLLVLGLVAGLASDYRQVAIYSARKDRTIQTAQVALEGVRKELGAAYQVLSPAPGVMVPVSTLDLVRVDPGAARLPGPGTVPWDAHDPAFSARVRYFITDEVLVREVTAMGSTSTFEMAEGLSGFSVQHLASGNFEIRLTVEEDKRARVLTSELFRMVMR